MTEYVLERDTVDEVVRAGRNLLDLCRTTSANTPPDLRRAAIEFRVLIDELADAAGASVDGQPEPTPGAQVYESSVEAYELGYAARGMGSGPNDCPFPVVVEAESQRGAWFRGWHDAARVIGSGPVPATPEPAVYVTPGHPVKAGAGYDCNCGACLYERTEIARVTGAEGDDHQ